MLRSRVAPGLLLALSLVWGSTWLANSRLADLAAPLRAISLRYSLASLCVALAYGCQTLVLARKASRLHSSKSGPSKTPRVAIPATPDRPSHAVRSDRYAWLRVSILLGLTMFAIPDLLLVWAAQSGAAPYTPLIYAGLPLGLLLAAGELRQPAILAVGAMFVLLDGSLRLTLNNLIWTLLIVVAVSLQGWSLLYARRHLAIAASLRSLLLQLITAVVVLEIALKLWPAASENTPLRSWPASSLGALATLAVLGTAVAYPLYYRLLAWLEPAELATTFWLQTLVAVGESAWMLRLNRGWLIDAAACVLIGCAVSMLRGDSAGSETSVRLSS